MEALLENISDAIANLVVTLTEMKTAGSAFTINIDGVRSLKTALDGVCADVDETLKTATMKKNAESASMMSAAVEELKKQAATLLQSAIDAKKLPNGKNGEAIESSLAAAQKILKCVVNLVLIEDRVNLETLAWFVKEVALAVRDLNTCVNPIEFQECCEISTKQLGTLTSFVNAKLTGDKYPEQKAKLRELVTFVSVDGPKRHWPAVAACLNDPEDVVKRREKSDAAEAIVDALDAITELLKEIFDANEAFIDAAFKRPPPQTLKKQALMDAVLGSLDALDRYGRENDDGRKQIVHEVAKALKAVDLRKLEPRDKRLAEEDMFTAQQTLQDILAGLQSPPAGGAGRGKGGVSPAEAEGLKAIRAALDALRHVATAPPKERAAHSRNRITDRIDDPAVDLPSVISRLAKRHEKNLDTLLHDGADPSHDALNDGKRALAEAIQSLKQVGPPQAAASKIVDAASAGLSPADILRARHADLNFALGRANRKNPAGAADPTPEQVRDVLDSIRRHIAAARAARLAGGGGGTEFDDALKEYKEKRAALRPLLQSGSPSPPEAWDPAYGAFSAAAARLTAAALGEGLTDQLAGLRQDRGDERYTLTLPDGTRRPGPARLQGTKYDVIEAVERLSDALGAGEPVEEEGARVLGAIRRHITAAREARGAMTPQAQAALDKRVETLQRRADDLKKLLDTKAPTPAYEIPLRQIAFEAEALADEAAYALPDPRLRNPAESVAAISDLGAGVRRLAAAVAALPTATAPLEAARLGQQLRSAVEALGAGAGQLAPSLTGDRRAELAASLKDLPPLVAAIDAALAALLASPSPSSSPAPAPALEALRAAAGGAPSLTRRVEAATQLLPAPAESRAARAAALGLSGAGEGAGEGEEAARALLAALRALAQAGGAASNKDPSVQAALSEMPQLISDIEKALAALLAPPGAGEGGEGARRAARDQLRSLADRAASLVSALSPSPASSPVPLTPAALASLVLSPSPADKAESASKTALRALDRLQAPGASHSIRAAQDAVKHTNEALAAAEAAQRQFGSPSRRREIAQQVEAVRPVLADLVKALRTVRELPEGASAESRAAAEDAVDAYTRMLRSKIAGLNRVAQPRPDDVLTDPFAAQKELAPLAASSPEVAAHVAGEAVKALGVLQAAGRGAGGAGAGKAWYREEVDEEGNITTYLTLTEDAMARLQRFLELAAAARAGQSDPAKRAALTETITALLPTVEALSKAAAALDAAVASLPSRAEPASPPPSSSPSPSPSPADSPAGGASLPKLQAQISAAAGVAKDRTAALAAALAAAPPPPAPADPKLAAARAAVGQASLLGQQAAEALAPYKEEIDAEGNITITLTLNRDAQDRLNRFLAAARAAVGLVADEGKRRALEAQLKALEPALDAYNKAASAPLGASAPERAANAAQLRALSDQLRGKVAALADSLTQVETEKLRPAEPIPSRPAPAPAPAPAATPTPALTPSPAPTPDTPPPLNSAADPKFFSVAASLQTRLQSYRAALAPEAQPVAPALAIAHRIAQKIAELGASIQAHDPKKIIADSKNLQATVAQLGTASKDFLELCKDKRLKEQYLVEVRALESLGTQLKILSTVCASQAGDVESQQKLLALTQKISEATQRALRTAELCALASRR